MTRRKPADMPAHTWVEQQIRAAEARGAFENLPGKGKPIPDLGRSKPELAWVADYLRRENIEVAGLLPPGLALAKEVEELPERLAGLSSEARVRAYVTDLNARIRDASRRTMSGPPVRVVPVDVEHAVELWRTVRAERAEQRAAAAAEARAALGAATPPPAPRRRTWTRWRREAPGV